MTIPAVYKFINWITGTPVPIDDAMTSALTPTIDANLLAAFNALLPAAATVFLPAGATHATGLVPDPGATAHTPPYFLMDDATFKNFVSQGYNLINGTIVESHSSNAATLAIKTLAGSDPSSTDVVYIIFRDSTAGTGDYVILPITSAFSIVISSGSTVGATSATAFRLWLVCFNDGGTARLGIINCLSGINIYPLTAWQIASSTAEGGAGGADSAQVFYTGSAVASKSYTILGYLTWESGLTTAGTWDASPTRIQIKDGATPVPGQSIQTVMTATGAVATGTTAVPEDDTIPQITEGNEYMTRAITPSSAASILDIETEAVVTHSAVALITISLFQDAVADSLATKAVLITALNNIGWGRLSWRMQSKLSVSTTFRFRAGATTGATTTFNGSTGNRFYGGVLNSYMKVTEYMA